MSDWWRANGRRVPALAHLKTKQTTNSKTFKFHGKNIWNEQIISEVLLFILEEKSVYSSLKIERRERKGETTLKFDLLSKYLDQQRTFLLPKAYRIELYVLIIFIYIYL